MAGLSRARHVVGYIGAGVVPPIGSGTPGVPTAPVNTSLPVISGTAQVGQILAASTGTWSGSPSSFVYQWARNGAAILGATAGTYLPTNSDIGATLTCSVSATNTAGSSMPAVTAATSAVIAAPVAPSTAGTLDFSDPANSALLGAI